MHFEEGEEGAISQMRLPTGAESQRMSQEVDDEKAEVVLAPSKPSPSEIRGRRTYTYSVEHVSPKKVQAGSIASSGSPVPRRLHPDFVRPSPARLQQIFLLHFSQSSAHGVIATGIAHAGLSASHFRHAYCREFVSLSPDSCI